MEAKIQSTNRAINIDINVSINIDALKANIQRGLQDAWKAIKQSVLMPIKKRVLQTVKQATNKRVNIGALTLPRLYRMVLLMSRAAVRTIDAHPTISNIFIWAMCAACFWAVLTYNFTTHI